MKIADIDTSELDGIIAELEKLSVCDTER